MLLHCGRIVALSCVQSKYASKLERYPQFLISAGWIRTPRNFIKAARTTASSWIHWLGSLGPSWSMPASVDIRQIIFLRQQLLERCRRPASWGLFRKQQLIAEGNAFHPDSRFQCIVSVWFFHQWALEAHRGSRCKEFLWEHGYRACSMREALKLCRWFQ